MPKYAIVGMFYCAVYLVFFLAAVGVVVGLLK